MEEPQPRVICHIEDQLQRNGMTLTQLSEQVGVSLANLSVLKNNRAKAVRFTTLVALCSVLDCQPGDLFTVVR
ncbi:helix-turn-helix domain-containing protein [Brevibacterium senegalense]|uniref:helix-turn-helix domain-containing protein n=1 Tax=Brevibacterium senegalense TaxID=1033736 RepID=UPI000314F7CE|nr:helix-turn-helix domain-containing protein [Brevibacterium senegalense]